MHRCVRPAVCLAALVLAACGDDGAGPVDPNPDPTPAEPARIRILPAEAMLTAIGDTLPLVAEVLDAAGDPLPDAAVAWSSGDTTVATVDSAGTVVSLAEGTAPIRATAGPTADTAGVAVAPAARQVTVEPPGATLHAVGDTLRLQADVRDPNGHPLEDERVAWVSLDTAVATVDSTGLVAARSDGTARIQAAAGQGWDEATVEVRRVAAEVTLSPAADTLREGESLALEAVVFDSNGVAIDDAPIAWSTSNPVVATVDTTGLVTAVRGGAAAHIGAASGPAAAFAEVYVTGTIAFWRLEPPTSPTTLSIDLVNADGSDVRPVTDPSVDARRPAWSPDGSRIAFAGSVDSNRDIYVMDADGDGTDAVAVTTDPAMDDRPAWSPDGTRLAFASLRDGDWEVYVVAVDGSSPPLNLTNDGSESWRDDQPTWSPDGTRIAFRTNRAGDGDYDIWVVDSDGTAPPEPLIATGDDEMDPAWSPDGGRIAYSGTHENERGIFVVDGVDADVVGVPQRLTTAESTDLDASWSPDGTTIAFTRRHADGSRAIYLIEADGASEPRALVDDRDFNALAPAWRPRP